MVKDKAATTIAVLMYGLTIDWIAMLVLGADGYATWGFWKVFAATWAIEGIIATSVTGALLLAS